MRGRKRAREREGEVQGVREREREIEREREREGEREREIEGFLGLSWSFFGQFTKNRTFINILAILRPIWPQLCMLNKSASHLRTSFLVLVQW